MKDERISTSIRIHPEIWKQAKRRALDTDKKISHYLEDLIQRDIEAQ